MGFKPWWRSDCSPSRGGRYPDVVNPDSAIICSVYLVLLFGCEPFYCWKFGFT